MTNSPSTTSGTVRLPVRIFSKAERAALDKLAGLMIPPSRDGRFPSAAALDLYAMTSSMSAADHRALQSGTELLNELAQQQFNDDFASLDAASAQQLVDVSSHQLSDFLAVFKLHTTARYLEQDVVLPLVGLPVRAPWPTGNEVKQGDWSLLDPVRARAKIYRDV